MPEITDAQLREYQRYQQFGTPDEVDGKVKKLETVLGENKEYRTEVRDLKAKLPADGAVVLAKEDELAKWTKVKDLDVDELSTKAAKSDELAGEIAKRDKAENRRRAAEAEGYKLTVLDSIAGAADLEYGVAEEPDPKDTGKKVPRGFVVVDGKKVRLSDYAKEKWAPEIVAALTSKPGGTDGRIDFTPERRAGGERNSAGPDDHKAAVTTRVDYSI